MTKTLNRNQQGVGHVMAILAIVVIITIGGIGYVVFSKQKDTANTNKSETTRSIVADKALNEACIKEINDKDFCKFAGNWSGTENYSTVITTKGTEGTSVMEMKTESSTRTSIVTKLDGKETFASISLDNVSYIKDYTDGKWTKYTSEPSTDTGLDVKDNIKFDDFTDSDAATAGKTVYKKIGKEACGSFTCFKYQIVDADDPTNNQFLWFDDKDYLLRKYVGNTIDETFEMVLSYGKVTVKAPTDVKEAPDYSSMSQEELEAASREAEAAASQYMDESYESEE